MIFFFHIKLKKRPVFSIVVKVSIYFETLWLRYSDCRDMKQKTPVTSECPPEYHLNDRRQRGARKIFCQGVQEKFFLLSHKSQPLPRRQPRRSIMTHPPSLPSIRVHATGQLTRVSNFQRNKEHFSSTPQK